MFLGGVVTRSCVAILMFDNAMSDSDGDAPSNSCHGCSSRVGSWIDITFLILLPPSARMGGENNIHITVPSSNANIIFFIIITSFKRFILATKPHHRQSNPPAFILCRNRLPPAGFDLLRFNIAGGPGQKC